MLCAVLGCLSFSAHALVQTPITDSSHLQSDELNINDPRLLKQMLNSEQAQHSIKVILAEQADRVKHDTTQQAMTRIMADFLREQDIATATLTDIAQLPTPAIGQHTVFLLNNTPALIEQYHTQLLTWVSAGGHLIVSAEYKSSDNSESALLQRLGIHKHAYTNLSQIQKHTAQHSTEVELGPLKQPQLTRLYLENEQSPAYFNLTAQHHLQDTDNRAHAWANNPTATHLLQLIYGDGLVTVISDFTLWQPQHIGQYDHAWLLWYLSQDTDVILLNPSAPPDIFTRLWPHSTALLVVLLALIVCSLGYVTHLFIGRRSSDTPRKTLTKEQTRALKQLSHSSQRSLLLSLQHDIQQRAQLHHPDFTRLVVVEQWQILRQLSGLPVTLISHSMRPPPMQKLSAKVLTQHVLRLRQLKNALPLKPTSAAANTSQ